MRFLANMKALNAIHNQAASRANMGFSCGFPEDITVTLTYRCNYRCKMCYQSKYQGEMDWDLVERVGEILPFAKVLQLFGGEPLLYPRVPELFALAQANGTAINMISNGSLLTPEMCRAIVGNAVNHIKFSIDAGTPATYKKIRGGDFNKVVQGVAHITKLKLAAHTSFPDMHFNFLAMRSNVKELGRLAALAANIGVARINVFYPDCHNEELVEECVYFCQEYSDEHLLRAKEMADRVGVHLALPPLFSTPPVEDPAQRPFCADPWTKLLLDIDGSAQLCCGGPTRIGSLLQEPFEDIWNSEAAQQLRRTVNTADEPAYCRICRVRKPNPHALDMHIKKKSLQQYALKRFGLESAA